MDGIISFIQMLVVPYSIFLLAVFMYCIWKCVWFVNDLIRLLLENNLNINVSENMFLLYYFLYILWSTAFIIPFYIVVLLIGNFFQMILVIIGIIIIVTKLKNK